MTNEPNFMSQPTESKPLTAPATDPILASIPRAKMKPPVRIPALLLLAAPLLAQTAEFVADPMPTPSCHASTIVEVRPGEFLAAWFGGKAEGNADVAIWGAHRRNGQWQPPAVLVREPNIAAWNPVLFRSADGPLWLYYLSLIHI